MAAARAPAAAGFASPLGCTSAALPRTSATCSGPRSKRPHLDASLRWTLTLTSHVRVQAKTTTSVLAATVDCTSGQAARPCKRVFPTHSCRPAGPLALAMAATLWQHAAHGR
eukprot:scaffold15438_cov36-Phaeocystis_antarctica.AAC.1